MTDRTVLGRLVLPALVCVLAFAALPAEAGEIALFYNATVQSCADPDHGCVVDMRSLTAGDYAYIRFYDPAGFELTDNTVVSADFKWLSGTFAGGSPRFDIATTDWSKYIYAYWEDGTAPASGWQTISLSSIAYVDYYDPAFHYHRPLSEAIAALAGVTFTKAYVSLDGGWAGTSQEMLVDNFRVNDSTYSPECASPVPEPASFLLFGTGLVGLRAWRKRRG